MIFDQSKVTAFYEQHPYPYRPPGAIDDGKIIGIPSDLRFINHYIFGGIRDFKKPFRVLVAGGGTGDAVIGLGRQLTQLGCPAEVVYIDLSEKSRRIAEDRVKAIGLLGVKFITGRIQDLQHVENKPFDYIDFCGVINHVGHQEPLMRDLAKWLAPTGGIGVMAYGKLGRIGVYHVQEMLTLVGVKMNDIRTTRALLKSLPNSNWHQKNLIFCETEQQPDVEIADRYLNPSDRAFTVAELRDLAEIAGLQICAFATPVLYDASCNINDENLLGILDKLGWIDRCIFAELYNGDILMHNYYMTGKNNTVNPNILINQKDTIPITISLPIGQAPRVIDGKFKLSISVGPLQRTLVLDGTENSAEILTLIDGRTTLQQIYRSMAEKISWRTFIREFAVIYRSLNSAGEMVLSTTPMQR